MERMKILGWITTLLSFLELGSTLPGRIHFGALFDADDWESELAFRTAVDWLNEDEILLNHSRVIVNLDRLDKDDSYIANRLTCNLLQNGLTAMFGPRSRLPAMHVQSICDNLEVPHINSRWDYGLVRDQLNVNLYPHPQVLSKAFLTILEVLEWREFFLVYEEDEAVVRMKDFIAEGEKKNWKIELYKFPFPNATSYREIFWEIKVTNKLKGKILTNKEQHIVLDVPRDHLYRVLKSAQQVGMMTEKQKYLITNLDFHTIKIEDFQYGKTNITGLRLVQEDTAEFQAVLRDINYKLRRRNVTTLDTLKTETALIFDSVRLLALALEHMDTAKKIAVFPPISCNLMNKGVDGTSLVNYMKSINTGSSGLSGMLQFDREGFRSRISLDIMYLSTHGLNKIGSIVPGHSVNITTPDVSEFQLLGLEKQHFRVTTFLNDPYAMLRESSQLMKGNSRFEGFGIDVLDALAEKLHFTYVINPVKDKKYGRQDPVTGKWDGMIGEIVAGVSMATMDDLDKKGHGDDVIIRNNDKGMKSHARDADMAIADLTITASRMKGVDFTLPFMQTGISILFKKPTQKVTSLFSFLLPFSGEVWLLIIIAYTYISLLLFLVGRMSPYEWMNPYPCRDSNQVEENCFSLLNSMWWAIGSLLQQGSDVAPTASSTRALTSTWSFFKLIMISSYTANLAAFLTVEKLVSPIEGAEDLAKQDKIYYGSVESGSTRVFFQHSNISTYQKMYTFMQKHASEVYVRNNNEGIAKVKKGNYAFMMEATTIEYNTERECNLTQIGGLLDSKGYGIAVKKGNSKLRNWLSGGILQLQEEGKIHTFKEKWWKQKKGGGKCAAGKTSGTVNELGLGNVGGVILVMILGMLLSACVGVVEFFWYQRKLRRDPEKSICKTFLREIKYAITCGSSSKAAPKFRDKKDGMEKEKAGYSSFT